MSVSISNNKYNHFNLSETIKLLKNYNDDDISLEVYNCASIDIIIDTINKYCPNITSLTYNIMGPNVVIPHRLCNLKNIKILTIYSFTNAHHTSIPEQIYLMNLCTLILDCNIVYLSPSINQLKSLKCLVIKNNPKLYQIPPLMGLSLDTLCLKNNGITQLTPDIRVSNIFVDNIDIIHPWIHLYGDVFLYKINGYKDVSFDFKKIRKEYNTKMSKI